MNNVLEILSELKGNGILLSLDETETNLKLKGNLSSLSNDNKDKLKKHKQDLIQFFKNNSNHFNQVIPYSETTSLSFTIKFNASRNKSFLNSFSS